MDNKVYYYISSDGVHHFSTGAEREGDKAEQYLRMLYYSKREIAFLDKERQEDRAIISQIFNLNI